MQLRAATPDDLGAFLHGGPDALASVLGVRIPAGWPEYPWVIGVTLTTLQEHPGQAGWWMYYFLNPDDGVLVGSGGYKGPPQNGAVEIGYEIAPGFRGQGYATAAARQLVDRAFNTMEVAVVEARTLPHTNASATVLLKAGFVCQGIFPDDQTRQAWLWRKTRPGLSGRSAPRVHSRPFPDSEPPCGDHGVADDDQPDADPSGSHDGTTIGPTAWESWSTQSPGSMRPPERVLHSAVPTGKGSWPSTVPLWRGTAGCSKTVEEKPEAFGSGQTLHRGRYSEWLRRLPWGRPVSRPGQQCPRTAAR